MPRRRRTETGGLVFHVLNRGAKRARLFESASDYKAFENLLAECLERVKIMLLAYCLMPNHWHLILSPEEDGNLSHFMKLLTGTHALRWNAFRDQTGIGAVYQGRFKAIPIQRDRHFLCACRYVERNPGRAGLVDTAADWRWCSLWRRVNHCEQKLLNPWPVPMPSDWLSLLAEEPAPQEIVRLQRAIRRGQPSARTHGVPKQLPVWERTSHHAIPGGRENSTRPLFTRYSGRCGLPPA